MKSPWAGITSLVNPNIFLFTFNHKLIQKSKIVSITVLEIPILDAGLENKISVGHIMPSS